MLLIVVCGVCRKAATKCLIVECDAVDRRCCSTVVQKKKGGTQRWARDVEAEGPGEEGSNPEVVSGDPVAGVGGCSPGGGSGSRE